MLSSEMYFYYSLGSFFEVQCCPQADSGPERRHSSVTQCEDGGANLEPTESANCVCLDFSAWLWEIKQHKPVTVTA